MVESEAKTSDLRGRKKARTRSILRSTALRLAMDQGPSHVTVEQICAEAEVSTRTFFNYFPNKDQVFFDVDPEHLAEITARIVERPADESPLDTISVALSTIVENTTHSGIWSAQLDLLRAHPELTPRMRGSSEAVKDALAQGLAQRLGTTTRDPYILTTATVALASIDLVLRLWLDAAEGTDATQLLDMVTGYLRTGLTPP